MQEKQSPFHSRELTRYQALGQALGQCGKGSLGRAIISLLSSVSICDSAWARTY